MCKWVCRRGGTTRQGCFTRLLGVYWRPMFLSHPLRSQVPDFGTGWFNVNWYLVVPTYCNSVCIEFITQHEHDLLHPSKETNPPFPTAHWHHIMNLNQFNLNQINFFFFIIKLLKLVYYIWIHSFIHSFSMSSRWHSTTNLITKYHKWESDEWDPSCPDRNIVK